MEEYSDLKFDGDLSFLNENLDAAKYAEKEAIIKQEIVKEESAKLAREEYDRQALARKQSANSALNEITNDELAREETDRLAKAELDRKEIEEGAARLAKASFERKEREEASARLEQEERNKIKTPITNMSEELTQKPIEKMEKSNETMNSQANKSVNENESALAPRMQSGIMNQNLTPSSEKKSQLEEMILNSGYGAEMFNNLKMELLELEKEKIIMKYKQDLMMMIIKS
ncbi:hypothetical protein [Flavobacterium sp. SM2513]|uniref:hypothetical protein n=1 Tax=Flavobacterium sp. SM2513 TaxID=3424766 RepID=UPI003D7F69AA